MELDAPCSCCLARLYLARGWMHKEEEGARILSPHCTLCMSRYNGNFWTQDTSLLVCRELKSIKKGHRGQETWHSTCSFLQCTDTTESTTRNKLYHPKEWCNIFTPPLQRCSFASPSAYSRPCTISTVWPTNCNLLLLESCIPFLPTLTLSVNTPQTDFLWRMKSKNQTWVIVRWTLHLHSRQDPCNL